MNPFWCRPERVQDSKQFFPAGSIYSCSLHTAWKTGRGLHAWFCMHASLDTWMDGWREGGRDGGMKKWREGGRDGGTEGRMHGGMNGWTDGRMDGWADGRMDG